MPMANLRNLRFFLWALVGMVAVSAALLTLVVSRDEPRREGVVEPGRPMAEGADWHLLDETGSAFTPNDVRAKPTLVVFGFTHCPDVCPTSLAYVAGTLQALGPQAEAVRPLFVTVDPERDTTDIMAEYTDLFDPRIVGVTGAPDQISAALKSLGAYSRKVPQDDGGYTMDHTATMLLLDDQGRPRSTLDIHEAPEIAAGKVRLLLEKS
jgi:protein SCO1/2